MADDNAFRRMLGRTQPSMSEHDPAFRILHNDLTAILQAVGDSTAAISSLVQHNADILDTYLVEGGLADTAGVSPFVFQAQTHDVELVTFILAWLPAGATNGFLQLDDIQIPILPGQFTATGCKIPVRKAARTLSWGNVQPTDRPFVLLCAEPAPANIPGILH